jgi:hypothetical protein
MSRKDKKMETQVNEVSINGKVYVLKGDQEMAESVDGMEYKIVRTYSAGVFAGYIKSRKGQEVEMVKARRLWQWYGAMSLSELAVDGTTDPNNCKFAVETEVTLINAIEILSVTNKAKKSIQGVKRWVK